MKIFDKKPLYNFLKDIVEGSIIINKNIFLFYKNNNSIVMYNKYLEKLIDFKDINKYYNGTTNDDVLYLLKKSECNKIFVANILFNEYDYIPIKLKEKEKIIDITFNFNTIILATNFNVFSINNKGEFIKNMLDNNAKGIIGFKDILYKQNIDGKLERINLSSNNITSILYYNNLLYIAFNKNGSAYICLVNEKGKILNKYFIEKNIIIKSIIHNGSNIKLLISKHNLYNYIYYLK